MCIVVILACRGDKGTRGSLLMCPSSSASLQLKDRASLRRELAEANTRLTRAVMDGMGSLLDGNAQALCSNWQSQQYTEASPDHVVRVYVRAQAS